MFFWSKKKAKSKSGEANKPATAGTQEHVLSDDKKNAEAVTATVKNNRPDSGQIQDQISIANRPTENLEKTKARQQQIAKSFATLGELTNLLMRAENYKDTRLADLDWLILPAIRLNQFRIARAQSKQTGLSIPIATVVWAKVSREVDQKLSAIHSEPIRLSAQEWNSGDILWIVLDAGDTRGVSIIINALRKTDFKGRPVKIRSRDASGNTTVKTITPV